MTDQTNTQKQEKTVEEYRDGEEIIIHPPQGAKVLLFPRSHMEGDKIVELPMIREDGSVDLFPVSIEVAAVWFRAFDKASKEIGEQDMKDILSYMDATNPLQVEEIPAEIQEALDGVFTKIKAQLDTGDEVYVPSKYKAIAKQFMGRLMSSRPELFEGRFIHMIYV